MVHHLGQDDIGLENYYKHVLIIITMFMVCSVTNTTCERTKLEA